MPGLTTPPITWGKLLIDEATGDVLAQLPLAYHCVDVASVFRALCDIPGIRRNLEQDAAQHLSAIQIDRLAVFALLHDLGKCNRGFQAKADPQARNTAGHVRETAALFFDDELRTDAVAALGLASLASWFHDPETDILRILIAAISHHGSPAFDGSTSDSLALGGHRKYWQASSNVDPLAALVELGQTARRAFPLAFSGRAEPLVLSVGLEHRFAGLLMLADWLGSHRESFFPFENEGERIPWARQQAKKALAAVGLDVAKPRSIVSDRLPSFRQVFDLEAEPKPLQTTLARTDLPPLLIAESDTGSGKTEAALMHFLALFQAGQVDGLYFALPTRVAAREIYDRVYRAMERVFGPDCPPVLLAVPGYAKVDGKPAGALPEPGTLWHDPSQLRRERAWAAERPKRFLAAPVAVGTIDQALLSVIQVPHAHLRAACLDRSLLVVDEVHSSDLYMRYLARRLLKRHLRAGGRALLLSATLGAAARAEYLQPGDKRPEPEPFEAAAALPYPALCQPGQAPLRLPDPVCREKTVRLVARNCLFTPEAMLPELRAALRQGHRVLVVLNTVNRAMRLARLADQDPELALHLFSVNGQACPHHGRFARPDREVLDKAVTARLGKGSPSGAVLLIGTQTLEQSLDIDADWLLTDLCPMDVLLQRIGRLHRHNRGARPTPVCTVLLPEEKDFSAFLKSDGSLARGGLAGMGSVYEDMRILQLTRNIVAGEPEIVIPRDNRYLVESATHPERLTTLTGLAWLGHVGRLEGVGFAQASAAHGALIPDKHFGDFLFPHGIEANLSTRLGLNDRILSLGGLYHSPFGQEIREITLPGHLARNLAPDAAVAHPVSQSGGMLSIHAGSLAFRYSRFGLEKLDESAP